MGPLGGNSGAGFKLKGWVVGLEMAVSYLLQVGSALWGTPLRPAAPFPRCGLPAAVGLTRTSHRSAADQTFPAAVKETPATLTTDQAL